MRCVCCGVTLSAPPSCPARFLMSESAPSHHRVYSKAAQLADMGRPDTLFVDIHDVSCSVPDRRACSTCPPSSLTPSSLIFQQRALYAELLAELQSASRECFFGQHLGFYHVPGVRSFLQVYCQPLLRMRWSFSVSFFDPLNPLLSPPTASIQPSHLLTPR